MEDLLNGISKEFLLTTIASLFLWGARLEFLANTLKGEIRSYFIRMKDIDARLTEQANASRALEMNVVQKLGEISERLARIEERISK